MRVEEVERLILESLPDSIVRIRALRDDAEGDHFEAYVESAAFVGLSRLDQHRLVFDALQGRVGATIQTFSLTTVVKS